ncbi:MAG: Na(+)-translocating NADH-quinone reductase subunit A [Woeseiaceae bacterium]
MRITIKKGLDIPIEGRPEQIISEGPEVRTVAAVATDVSGILPRMAVQVGDRVRRGQALYRDKRNPEVPFAAPGTGEVIEINRGARRALQSVVIRLDGDDSEEFTSYSADALKSLDRQAARDTLIASGLWTTFRTRPLSRIPGPDDTPAAIFVTAIDTRPLAADPSVIIAENPEAFRNGLDVLSRLTDGAIYINTAPDSGIDCPDGEPFRHAEFAGPHPAGLPGTHIHFLEPVSLSKTVWHIGYQHVMGIGKLFTSGQLSTERVIALGGPMVLKPRLIRTRIGANTADLLQGETKPGQLRVISGSVLAGHRAAGPLAYLGRYETQVAVLEEGSGREFLSFVWPGASKYSATRSFAGHLLHRQPFPLTTTQNGSPRAMVSIGSFERIMPLDMLATPLLKALLVEDTDRAQQLGCLELAEEDLALCSFVCNGKHEYGAYLRMNLDEIEANG